MSKLDDEICLAGIPTRGTVMTLKKPKTYKVKFSRIRVEEDGKYEFGHIVGSLGLTKHDIPRVAKALCVDWDGVSVYLMRPSSKDAGSTEVGSYHAKSDQWTFAKAWTG